jgi:MFS family permease
MVSCYQLAITVGILGSYLSNSMVLKWSQSVTYENALAKLIVNDEVWRGMLGIETVPALMFLLVLFLIPESPRWLVLRKKETQSVNILKKIYTAEEAMEKVAEIKQLIGKEERSDWRLLLKRGFRTALIIGISLAMLGQFMGVNAVFYYGPKFLGEAGLGETASLDLQVWVGLVNVVSTILAMLVIDKIGRKKLIYIGVTGMIILLAGIGCFFYSASAGYAVSTWLLFVLILL